MDGVKNPIVGYADSYRLMQRDGAKTIDIWSIITDLERNMVPAVEAQLAALREELAADCVAHDAETDLLRKKLTAAEQRNAELLERAKELTIWMHAEWGNTEIHPDCIRDLAVLNPKPTESGASDKCASDGGTCGLGGHCGECPHVEAGASE